MAALFPGQDEKRAPGKPSTSASKPTASSWCQGPRWGRRASQPEGGALFFSANELGSEAPGPPVVETVLPLPGGFSWPFWGSVKVTASP